jgi:peptide chain release factor 1
MTIYKLDYFLDGDLDEIIDGLITSDRAAKMQAF